MLISLSDHPAPAITRHPVSACQPDLDADATAILLDSIRRDGVQSPILITSEGAVVDGWHRLHALIAADPLAQSVPCLRILSEEETVPSA